MVAGGLFLFAAFAADFVALVDCGVCRFCYGCVDDCLALWLVGFWFIGFVATWVFCLPRCICWMTHVLFLRIWL